MDLDLALIVFVLLGIVGVVQSVFVGLARGGLDGYAYAFVQFLQGVGWLFVGMMYEEKSR